MQAKKLFIVSCLLLFSFNLFAFKTSAEDEKGEKSEKAEKNDNFSRFPDTGLEVASQEKIIDREKKPTYSPLIIGQPIIAIPTVESEESAGGVELIEAEREEKE